jgi:hypothetical protein
MGTRNKVLVSDLSSCSWYCDDKLRLKGVTAVIDSTGADMPSSTYEEPVGTVPDNIAEGALIIEIWDNGLGFFQQTSCDSTTYSWTALGNVATGVGTGNLTTFQLRSGDSGVAPASPGTPPSSPTNGDNIIQRYNDYTNFWTRTGGSWVLTYQDSNSENYNTFFEDNSGFDVPATSADPPNPGGTNPSSGLQLGDTYITKYATHTVWYTYSGSAWVEDFRTINATIASLAIGTGLTNTTGTISANISTGVSGGQSIYGGTASGNNLTIYSTSHATKGKIIFGTSAYDEVNNRLGIGTTSPTKGITLVGSDALINTLALGLGNSSIATNTALGVTALNANTTGNVNTAIGYEALKVITTGSANVGLGYKALNSVTTGFYNTAIGAAALGGLTGSSSGNTAIGREAMSNNGSGNNNTALGYGAGSNGSGSGANNIYIGYNAGNNLTTGSTNIIIGYDIDAPVATTNYQLSIGNLIFGTNLSGTGTSISPGNIGIGEISPTARLHLAAGTAAASTAPLKLNTGTALTTPENGALEYHTSHLYFTIGATRYQLDQQLASANNGVSYSAGVLQLGLSTAGTGSADFTANRYLYTGAFDFSIGGSVASATTYPIFYLKGATGLIAMGGTTSPTSTLTITNRSGLGAAPSLANLNLAGLSLTTGAVATVGAQEVSNPVRWSASGWGTTGSAAQTIDYTAYVLPIQGTAPTADWILQSSINGAAYGSKLYYSSTGNLSLGTNATATAKLQVKGTAAATTVLFETSTSTQLLKLTDSSNELGNSSTPLNLFSTKEINTYGFTAISNNESGITLLGTATARATASDTINGILLNPTLVSAAATQILNALKINATFTDAFSATKYLLDLQTSSVSHLNLTSEGKLAQTATFTATTATTAAVTLTGLLTARATASDIIAGLYVTTGLTGAAATQTLAGTYLKQTLTASVGTQSLNGLTVDTTFAGSTPTLAAIFNFKNAGTSRLILTDDGRLYGTALHNNAGAVTGVVNQYIASGTYTPTVSNTNNIVSTTPGVFQWNRVGNVVTISGFILISTTGTGTTDFDFTLPIPYVSATGGAGHISSALGSIGITAVGSSLGQCDYQSANTSGHYHALTLIYVV